MNSRPLRLGLIYGSSRRDRLCDTIGSWAQDRLAQSRYFDIDLIDPQQLDLPALLHQEDCAARQALRLIQAPEMLTDPLELIPPPGGGAPEPLRIWRIRCVRGW